MNIIGYFVSPVLIRADLHDNPSFDQLLAQIKTRLLSALDHQDYPLIRLIEGLKPQHDAGGPTLYQTNFAFQQSQPDKHKQDELVLEPIPFVLNAGREPISLGLTETSTGIKGYLKGDATLFTPETLARMGEHFQYLLEGVAAELRSY
jgi:non-ribosomal peptide synthetase component F